MKTPVIIAAHNEEAMIGRTLDSLDARLVEPHVVANGCEDQTAQISRSYGAVVYETPDAGKLPAIQAVLKSLGDRALEPILYTDADSYPRSTNSWCRHMLGTLEADKPSAVSGPITLDTIGPSGLAYSAKYCLDILIARRDDKTRFRGANMATNFQTVAALKRVLELPHIWPGEDRAVELAILDEGGLSRQVVHPGATVVTSSRYVFPISSFLTEGRESLRKKSLALYRARAAEGSIPLGRYLKDNKSSTQAQQLRPGRPAPAVPVD